MWEWIQGLESGAATFLGALAGSLLGLLAILAGALYNAKLNRDRDDRLREQERKALAAALAGETFIALVRVRGIPATLRQGRFGAAPAMIKWNLPIYSANLVRLDILGPSCATNLTSAYSFVSMATSGIEKMAQKPPENPDAVESFIEFLATAESMISTAYQTLKEIAESEFKEPKLPDLEEFEKLRRTAKHPSPSHVRRNPDPGDV